MTASHFSAFLLANRLRLLTVLGFFFSSGLCAQILLYPVRQDHRWGFITSRGRVMIEPLYEAFGETNLPWNLHPEMPKTPPSEYRLAEWQGAVGLLNSSLREVLPCRYRRIRPLSHHYFAVERDSGFQIADRQGQIVLPDRFDDVCAVDTFFSQPNTWLLVKKNGQWGVWQRSQGILIQPQYDDIAWAGKAGYFRVKPKNAVYWALINEQNRLLLQPKYQDIVAAHANCILVRDPVSDMWGAVDANGNPLFNFDYRSARPINRHFVWLIGSDQKPALWNIARREWVDLANGAGKFGPLDENYMVCSRYFRRGVMDSTGTIVVAAKYDSVALSGLPQCYRVLESERYWGLMRPGQREPVLSTRFSSIEVFSKGISIVCAGTGCGVVNESMEEVVAFTFKEIERQGDTLLAFDRSDQMFRFRNMGGGRVQLLDNFEEVLSIKVGGNLQFVEAKPFRKTRRTLLPLPLFDNPLSRPDSSLYWQKEAATGQWELIQRSASGHKKMYADQRFQEVKSLLPASLTGVYYTDKVVFNRFSRLMARNTDRLCKMKIFDLRTGKMAAPSEWTGVRRSDFDQNLPTVVVIDTAGYMGLVRRTGEEVLHTDGRPLRYTYIGEFINGRARVCAGGVLRLPEPDEEYPQVEAFAPFARRYELIEPCDEQSGIYGADMPLIVAATGKSQPRWGYIDSLGNVLQPPQFDFAEDFTASKMAMVRQGNGWGLLDTTFHLVIPCAYKDILPLGDTLFKVSTRNPYIFYFNQRGHQLCAPQYERYGGFAGGRCAVRRDSLWGFLDEKGREVIACRYESVRPFSDGMAAVLDSAGWVFIDTAGVVQFRTQLPRAGGRTFGAFHDGRCPVLRERKWGYWDKTGQLRIPNLFAAAGSFRFLVAPVKTGQFYGLADTAGQWVVKPEKYALIEEVNTVGLARFQEKAQGAWGFMDRTGKVVAEAKYMETDSFQNGYARVRSAKGWGLMNAAGREVIPCGHYAAIGAVSEGIVAVLPHLGRGQWVYADTLNRCISRNTFRQPGTFQQGYALVEGGRVIDRWGEPLPVRQGKVLFLTEGIFGRVLAGKSYFFTDVNGNNLFGRYYDDIQAFQQGIAKIKKGNKWGAINVRGVPLVQAKFNFVHLQKDGNFIVRPPVLYGVISRTGRTVVPPEYDYAEWMQGGLIKLELGEKTGYVRPDGSWIWKMSN